MFGDMGGVKNGIFFILTPYYRTSFSHVPGLYLFFSKFLFYKII